MKSLLVLLLVSTSAQAAEMSVRRDVPYTQPAHERQTLDIYAPTQGTNHPIVVWIHGGGWRRGDKANVQRKPQALVERGFVFVSVNYRLAPQATVRQMAVDIAKAIAWIREHAEQFGGDPQSIFVAGHSAGAHLAALVCTDGSYLKAEKLSLASIKGCIPVDTAAYDVAKQIKSRGKLRAQVYTGVFGTDEKTQKQLSPMTYVGRGQSIPPFLILHVADRPDSTAQSRAFAQALKAAGVSARVVPGINKTHASINRDLGLPEDEPTKALFAFLNEQLASAKRDVVSFQRGDGRLRIVLGEQPIAEYVWSDEQVLRPYFRHLRTPSGIQVTRNHPPVSGRDLDDHATMHPGLWLAFGDINGVDFWRNQGRVRHLGFIHGPEGGRGIGTFTARNAYQHGDRTICHEDRRIAVAPSTTGYIIDWTSTFYSDQGDFTFGDQEEMGLGVRMATPLAVVKGGTITDSQGRKNETQIWGRTADWCRYGGELKGRHVGVVLMPHPHNFRRSWFHARDYGLLAANPFGRNAFTKGEKSRVTVKQGDRFVLRFRVLVYDVPQGQSPDVAAVYREYVESEQQP